MKYVLSLAMIAISGIQCAGMALAQSDRDHDSTREYSFGARRHLDTLADRLRREANTICWEMYDNYQHAHEYHVTYREMYTVLEDSIHIHDLAHDAAHRGTDNEDHIAEDLHEMDRLFIISKTTSSIGPVETATTATICRTRWNVSRPPCTT